MNTEITKTADLVRGWIFYDAACALCVQGRERAGRLFEARGFEWLPLQTPGSAARLGVPESAFVTSMHLLTADGRVRHNADALGVLCRSVWWLWPFGLLLLVPGFRELGRLGYDWLARNRYCIGGACRVEITGRGHVALLDLAIALLPPVLASVLSWSRPPWVLMWAMAFGMGFGLKWLTWRDAICHGACPSARKAFIWFIVWPGLDGRAFLASDASAKPPGLRELLWAAAMITVGALLIWVVFPLLFAKSVMLAAWAGMIGIAPLLHFGVIRLISILCRSLGVNAAPIMNAPLHATSLAEFWSARWNTAFSIPARRFVLMPLTRCLGLPLAGFIVFLLSGLLHEFVISLPARAGFGLPTLYFLVQAAGVAIERSYVGRRWRLSQGMKGWCFMAFFTVGPLYWLFHPVFMERVIVPFLSFLNHF